MKTDLYLDELPYLGCLVRTRSHHSFFQPVWFGFLSLPLNTPYSNVSFPILSYFCHGGMHFTSRSSDPVHGFPRGSSFGHMDIFCYFAMHTRLPLTLPLWLASFVYRYLLLHTTSMQWTSSYTRTRCPCFYSSMYNFLCFRLPAGGPGVFSYLVLISLII